MSYAPSINWSLALALGGTGSRGLPEVDSRQVQQLVADLRVTARRAGELAAARLGVDSPGASRISVVDWAGWGRAVRSMVEATVDEFDLPRRPAGPLNRLRGAGNAVLLGAGLRMASRRLLGQFDAYTGSDSLYLIAPTIVAHERSHGFVPSDFRLWVALHEQTHALQFRAAPWLRGWIAERARTVFEDDAPPLPGLVAWARTGDLASMLATGEAGEALGELVAAMTFLEGHADHTADNAGRGHVRTVRALRKAFTRPKGASGLGRFSSSLDKSAQYRDGLAFCDRITALKGRAALMTAFAQPGNLPRPQEITEPRRWLDRVDG